jgi:hypothetical protein
MDQANANEGASKSVTDLQHRVPNATAEECQRFHESFSEKSTERLTAYLEWRNDHQLNSPLWDETTTDPDTDTESAKPNDDARNWQKATELAIAHARKTAITSRKAILMRTTFRPSRRIRKVVQYFTPATIT